MTQTPVTPSRFAGLAWDDLQAPATERFWTLYRYRTGEGKRTMALAGITARKTDDAWIVYFNPVVAGDKAADIVSTLELSVFAIRPVPPHVLDVDRIRAEEQAKAREAKDLKRSNARNKLVDRFGTLADTDLIAAAQAQGRATWQQWHGFCVSKKRICEFSAIDARISLSQAAWLTELVDQTSAKAAHLRDNLTASNNAVEWSDDEVADAVESLCWHDMDQATEENGAGWSKADSSKGHWCSGMIRNGGADRSIGIDAARSVVGKYSRQLAKGEAV
nr:hypothetical protein [uncultured Devosia sp.]